MKFQPHANTLEVSGLTELNATNAGAFRDATRAALTDATTVVDVDLSLARFLDSSGLGALIALQKTLAGRGGRVRLLNPTATTQQILELTRLHRILEIVKS
jgi:anti-anti-sigma factor